MIYRKRRKFGGTKVWRIVIFRQTLFANINNYRLPVYGLIHVPLHLRILNYTRQEKTMSTCILKYFKLVKPAADHLPDPEGTLCSKLPSLAIASANLEIRSVMATSNSRGPYLHLTPAQKFQIGKRASERHFQHVRLLREQIRYSLICGLDWTGPVDQYFNALYAVQSAL